MRTCVICGDEIEHLRWNVTACAGECRRRRQQVAVLRYRAENPAKHSQQRCAQRARKRQPKSCVVCGETISGRPPNAQLCSEACVIAQRKAKYQARAERRRALERQRWSERRDDAEFMRRRRANGAAYRERNRDDVLRRKREDYERNRKRYLSQQKTKRESDIERSRAMARKRAALRTAALKLIREIEAKGLEALL